MRAFLANILLALTWCAVTGTISLGTLVTGFILGYLLLLFTQPLHGPSPYFSELFKVIGFGLYFAKELIEANFRVAYMVIKGPQSIRPGIVAIPLDVKTDLEITMLANLITLTPGTLSLDVSDDRKTLYIHVLYMVDADEIRKKIKEGLERHLLETIRR